MILDYTLIFFIHQLYHIKSQNLIFDDVINVYFANMTITK